MMQGVFDLEQPLFMLFLGQKDAVEVQLSLVEVHVDPFPRRCGWDEILTLALT